MEIHIIVLIILLISSIGIGVAAGYFLKLRYLNKRAEEILEEANSEAEVVRKEKELLAKEKFLELKEKHEKYIQEKNSRIIKAENKLKQRENILKQRKEELGRETKNFEYEKKEVHNLKKKNENKLHILTQKETALEELTQKQVEKLETISGYSAEEAKEELLVLLKNEAKTAAMVYRNEIVEDAKMNAKKEAKHIIIKTIQRIGTETAIENAVTVFHIDSDDIKGRIIGREGRNIRALEAATGIEIIVDDTPETILLSGFDPVRREVARLALHQLVTDGRIHPARIEEVVEKTRKQLEEEMIETGKKTCIDLGIHGLNNKLMRIIGKMKYRSSYGQNLLQHSRETANLCAAMATELGLNANDAKRAGLLHDIGKVPNEEIEIPHALYGMKIAEKYGENPNVCNAIGAHHDEIEMTSLIAPVVQICDAISGARPGARREVTESYIKRIKELEQIALSEEGVIKTYAIQAGRELRVIVGSDKVTDNEIDQISLNVAERIEKEMTYPGQIKITVIREKRSVSYAK